MQIQRQWINASECWEERLTESQMEHRVETLAKTLSALIDIYCGLRCENDLALVAVMSSEK